MAHDMSEVDDDHLHAIVVAFVVHGYHLDLPCGSIISGSYLMGGVK